MAKYQLIVGNLGTVVDTHLEQHATKAFGDYKTMSESGRGRVGGEPVTLYVDGEPDPRYTYEPQDQASVADGA